MLLGRRVGWVWLSGVEKRRRLVGESENEDGQEFVFSFFLVLLSL